MALALSGGGDSMALLFIAAEWARRNGRRLLALTVDHELHPDSARWTAFAGEAARAAGADWRALRWTGDKPATGLPAAARAARHRLVAEAARAAGARVVLFAHTADDIAEGETMRAEGSTLGRLRGWTPSPAWPEGRGLMLLRPMLGAGRAGIRAWLEARGADWLDDPANDDPRFARSRARQELSGRPSAPVPAGVSATDELAVALVCAGGGDRLPRGSRLAAVRRRAAAGEVFTATLCGARIEARPDGLEITREAGELLRRPPGATPLKPGVETVWDGRYAITVDAPGWSVAPAAGLRMRLSKADRARLAALPASARGAEPVLIRNDGGAPILASATGQARSLVEERLGLALDRMTHERDLGPRPHGASPRNHLFSA